MLNLLTKVCIFKKKIFLFNIDLLKTLTKKIKKKKLTLKSVDAKNALKSKK